MLVIFFFFLDLLKNQKIVNKFDCWIIKIKELIDRKSNKEASNNLVVSYQNHSERIKEVEKKEAKYDMRSNIFIFSFGFIK